MTFVRPLRLVADAVAADAGPAPFARGVALGMLVGLVPKENLTAALLAVLLAAVRVNLPAAGLAAVIFSLVGSLADPLTHVVGKSLLTGEWLRGTWASFFQLPLAPWTGLNNTVVLGSLLLGLGLLYPVYRGAVAAHPRVVPPIAARVRKSRLGAWLWGRGVRRAAGARGGVNPAARESATCSSQSQESPRC